MLWSLMALHSGHAREHLQAKLFKVFDKSGSKEYSFCIIKGQSQNLTHP